MSGAICGIWVKTRMSLRSSGLHIQRIKTMFEKGLLAQKRILITGGGSGLGAAMGRRFAELGAELIVCGRRPDVLEKAASAIREAFGSKTLAIPCDIRDGTAVEAMMETIWSEA